MTLNLNGIEIEIPGEAQVKVSEDGKKVTITVPEPKETIRVVEVESDKETIRFIPGPETIRYIENPCTKNHYPNYYPYYPYTSPNTWPYGTQITYTGTTTATDNGSYTIGGSCLSVNENLNGGSTFVSNLATCSSSTNFSSSIT
jgi:hypothetical protein